MPFSRNKRVLIRATYSYIYRLNRDSPTTLKPVIIDRRDIRTNLDTLRLEYRALVLEL